MEDVHHARFLSAVNVIFLVIWQIRRQLQGVQECSIPKNAKF